MTFISCEDSGTQPHSLIVNYLPVTLICYCISHVWLCISVKMCILKFCNLQGTNHDIPLKVLVLNGCSSLSDELVSRFSGILCHLQVLDLSSCFHVTDIGLSAITCSLINLQSLRLSWCINITDNGLNGIIQSKETLLPGSPQKKTITCTHKVDGKQERTTSGKQVKYIINFNFCCLEVEKGRLKKGESTELHVK